MHSTSFVPHPPLRAPRHPRTPRITSSAPPRTSRRAVLKLLPLLLLPTPSLAGPKPLEAYLTPLISLQATLKTLSGELETGTNADIRRVMKTLLIAANVPENLKGAVGYLPRGERERVFGVGREAYEYLDMVVQYYDPVDGKRRLGGDVLAFCLAAVERAEKGLGDVVKEFDDRLVERIRADLEF